MQRKRVAILAFEGISPFHLAVPCMVFNEAAQAVGINDFQTLIFSEQHQPLMTASGFYIHPQQGLDILETADVVIIPSWQSAQMRPSQILINHLKAASERGAHIVGLCIGAYVLAYAGLLNGRRATTHWAYIDDFSQRFNQVRLEADTLYIEQKNIITSAGTAAAIDCCLQLMRNSHGSALANRIARMMVVAPQRSGNQAQFIEQPVPQKVQDQKMAALLDDVCANLSASYNIDILAKKMAMSRRSFTRHFKALTGQTLGQWLLQRRLSYCQKLLEGTDLSIERISTLCGFNSPTTLRLHFSKAFGISPRDWRRAFMP